MIKATFVETIYSKKGQITEVVLADIEITNAPSMHDTIKFDGIKYNVNETEWEYSPERCFIYVNEQPRIEAKRKNL